MQFVVCEDHFDRTLRGGSQCGAQHLGSRGGVAKCKVLLELLPTRFPHLSLASEPEIAPTTFLKHMTAMPVTFES